MLGLQLIGDQKREICRSSEELGGMASDTENAGGAAGGC